MAMFNYESDELYQQVKGEALPSSPVYVAECKKEIIDEVSPNYPQLVEYEKEWFNFAKHVYHEGTPVPLEYQEVETDDFATVNNAIPFYYKSAILKGKTLVNTVKGNVRVSNKGMNVVSVIPTDKSKKSLLKFRVNKVATVLKESATQMAVKLQFFSGGNPKGYHSISNENFNVGFEETIVVEPLASGDVAKFIIWIPRYESGELDIDILFIEYQDGMENWDIPYFEGMQSVKMPVLTTTGENVLNPKNFVGWNGAVESNDGVIINVIKQVDDQNMRMLYTNMNLPLNTYTITVETVNGNYLGGKLCVYDDKIKKVHEFSINSGKASATITSKISQLKIWNPYGVDCQIRITITTNGSTTYEPYKSNILTVNEDVTLRSNGDVYDELNLLTGRLTQRIDENNEVLAQEVVKTVDLSTSIKPYDDINHYHVSSDTIPPHLSLSVPVVSTGNQTLNNIITEE